jgi:membrane-bound ClpP family serine protease
VFRYTNKRDGSVEYFCEAELDSQADPTAWTRGDEVTTPGRPLRVKGETAAELALSRQTADNFAAFKQRAFVAGVCFLLFFWSRYLEGTAGWLEVLLFLGGVGCILLELFVLPGVAIFGLGGGLMIIVSLILASQTFVLPHNDYQLAQLRDSLLGLIGAGVGVVLVAMLMRRYLPHTPFFSHVVLEPPSDAELEDLAHREAIVDFHHLLGHQGVATTQLTPSGKARFGNELVAVTTDGEVISRGTEVLVVEVHGNRVVVQSAATV